MAAPRIWHAPGRVNLIGDHTDYAEGFVLPMAIDRECVVTVRDGERGRLRARSHELDGEVDIPVDGRADPRTVEPAWGRFVAGALRALLARGAHVPALELHVTSSVPPGSGLSSSSALSVALTLALADAAALDVDRREMARAALDSEVRATGVPGGLMDQLTSLFGSKGHALLIDCRDLSIDPIALPSDVAVLVVHCGVARTLAGSEYAERRAATETAAARLSLRTLRDARLDQVDRDPRARHVVSENARVLRFAAALRSGDLAALGPLLLESHASLRDDFEVSTPELDTLVEALVAAGASGARLTGAGFGGCVVALADASKSTQVLDAALGRYREATGLEPLGFRASAADGAGRRSLSA